LRCQKGSFGIGIILFALLLSLPALAQHDRVDEYILKHMEEKQIPGLALIVLEAGRIVRAEGYGLANIEHDVPVRPNTIFQSASVGKQFTAAAVMMLAESGKIGLDDPVGEYLDDIPENWSDITVRHLLNHTSGLKDYDEEIDLRRDYTEEEFLRVFAEQPPDFAPGEHWSYSNTGYVLLGMIIRAASGQYWGDFVARRIFSPLGMKTARVISEADIIPHRAAGYRLVDGRIKNQEWVSPSLNSTADGALYFSVLDLARWDAALYTEDLLSQASREVMWSPARLNDGREVGYGLGWWVGEVRGHRVVQHSGGWQGFSSHIARYIDDSLTVAVLTNGDFVEPLPIVRRIAGFYNEDLAPAERKEIALSPEVLAAYAGKYQFPSRWTLETLVEDDRLVLLIFGDKQVLRSASSSTFYNEDETRELIFIKDEKGDVTHLLYDRGVVQEARKIE
jgi:CubicO group peptidase (beta-lactamase class C family)